MQRPIRNSQTCTSDILTWPENSPPLAASTHRPHQPSDKIGEVLRRDKLTDEEAQSLSKKKPSSGYRMKESTASRIFSTNTENTTSEANSANSKDRTGIRVYQKTTNGISQISFNTEESTSPKKPTSLPEAAKQRELGGTLQNEPDTNSKKLMSSSKTKEFGGNDIFGTPRETVPRPLAVARTLDSKVSSPAGGRSNMLFGEEAVQKTSKKIHDQKFAELTGNDIFKGDVTPGSVEKPLSMVAKLREMAGSNIFADGKAENIDRILGARREMAGSDIFADGKAENRDRILGARRDPGGGSNIFSDGKAENRDRILGARRPPGGGSSIVLD